MRKSCNEKIIVDKSGTVIGINLGADYCAEHEQGIDGLKSKLGINVNADFGLARRIVNEVKDLHWIESDLVGIVLNRFYSDDDFSSWVKFHTDRYYTKNKFEAGWSNTGFYLLTKKNDIKTIEKFKLIYDALCNKNACIWMGGSEIFENAGFCIGIVDRMSPNIFNDWAVNDKKQHDLKDQFDKTGIEKFLKEANKKWFDLGPRLNRDGKMIIWLNPYDQDKYNSGYFTVDELKMWVKEKGPVIKKDKQ